MDTNTKKQFDTALEFALVSNSQSDIATRSGVGQPVISKYLSNGTMGPESRKKLIAYLKEEGHWMAAEGVIRAAAELAAPRIPAREALLRQVQAMADVIASDLPDSLVAQQWADFIASHYKAIDAITQAMKKQS